MVTRTYLTMHCNAPPGPLSRTSSVVFQAKPLIAATEEVCSLAMRFRVRGGARRRTRGSDGERTPPRACLLGDILHLKPILESFPPHEGESICAARHVSAQPCLEGAACGCQGEEPRRLTCRPPAYRQGALPPMCTVVCAGVPHRSPRVLRPREYSSTPGVL